MILALFLSWAFDLSRLWRDTNAHAATARGVKAYNAKQYGAAVTSMQKANALRSTPQRELNLGTAQIAAGDREHGAAALDKAMADPRFRADALYNRGTSALGAKAYDSAIRDYVGVLKMRPSDAAAKRNLEIAQALKQAAQQSSGNRKGQHGPQPQAQKPQPHATGEQPQPKGETDLDALLRSVQQQEKEELNRMHRAQGERAHVGW